MKKKKLQKELVVQGRKVTGEDILFIKSLMVQNVDWNRSRLSRELCYYWNWCKPGGQLKDMACRSLLLKLERQGYIELPKALRPSPNINRNRHVEAVLHSKEPVNCGLEELSPIELQLVEKGYELNLFKYFISAYHYLGWSGTVGENLKYLILDKHQRPLGCLMFGAAAWKVQPRDSHIGWGTGATGEAGIRKRNLSYIANNSRFLILPWIRVSHLASHILGKVSRRLSNDWQKKYHHPIYLLETFVEKDRFNGTCYKAANWLYVGDTQGRGKLDVNKEYPVAVKSIWLYPLDSLYRKKLCNCNCN